MMNKHWEKNLLFFLASISMALVSCVKQDDIDNLQKQIDNLKSNEIATVQQQMSGIQLSLGNLQTVDTELRGYIRTLQDQESKLAQADEALEGSIASLKTELSGDINAAKADALAQLEAYKANVSSQLASLRASIDSLKSKDADLQSQITSLQSYIDGDLKTYIDNGDKSVKTWASASFATLEQYNSTAETVSGIQTQIGAINSRLDELSASVTGVSKQDLDAAIDALDADHQTKLNKAVSDCNAAIASAKEEITAAYTAAISSAISASESSMKSWVNNQLSGYYTIAQTDAKIAALKTNLEGQLNTQKTYLEGLISNLETNLTRKINSNKTLIDDLQSQINGLGTDMATLSGRVSTNASNISANAEDIVSNARAISANAGDIDACERLIAENKRLIQANESAISDNGAAITALQNRTAADEGNISQNAADISANAAAIAKNAEDIAANAALIASNATAISNNARAISDNAAAIAQLRTDLNTTKTEITAAYQQAISTAISTLDGQLRGEIATQVETVNSRIDDEVAAVNATIDALTARVTQCEKDIRNIKNTIYAMQQDIEDLQEQVAAILARIQSISFVPAYSDGKVPVNYTDNGTLTPGTATLDFELQPASTAAELVQVWQTALKMKAVYTITKAAPETVQLIITSATADNGYLTVTVSGSALKEDFFRSRCSANAALTISDGNNELASEYVQLVPWTTDVISFGDPLFKAYCVENFDTDGDGEISEDEAKAVTAINASMLNITSLVGIEYFSNLESIDVSFNKLETLDLSHSTKLKEVLVNGNKLQSLNLSGLADIETLDCSNNKLTALNVSAAEGLLSLNCTNNQIGALNVKKNKALTDLQCSNNQLTALDLKNNTALVEAYCRKNDIKTIDISKLTALTHLDCSNNSLTSLDVEPNASLEILYCYSNSLTSLRLGNKPALTIMDCSQNSLTYLNLFGCANLEDLNCSSNSLRDIDVSALVNMTTLSCENNDIASLDVSALAALQTLKCTSDKLIKLWVKDAAQQTAINITKHNDTAIMFNNGGINIPDAKLKAYLVTNYDENGDGEISPTEADLITSVNCSGKSIADLTGIEACTNLQYLNCSGNSLIKLDLHTLTNLQTLVCHDNKLEDINLDNCTALTTINIIDATTNAYTIDSNRGPEIRIKEYTQSTTIKFSMDVIKGRIWVYASPSLTSVDMSDNSCSEIVVNDNSNMTSVKVPASLVNYFGHSCALQQIDFSNCPNLKCIQIYSNQLTSLDVSHNPKLHTIQAQENQLSALDISNNPEMKSLKLANNQLSSIHLLGNIKLEDVDLGNNNLSAINVRTLLNLQSLSVSNNTAITDINVSNNTALKTLNVYATSISTLDVSKNTALTSLVAKSTPITVLDVSANTALESLNVANTSIASLDVSNNTSLASLDMSASVKLIVSTGLKSSIYKVGQYVSIEGVTGVVYEASSKKIVSTDETSKTWDYYGTITGATSTTDGVANTNKIAANSAAAKWCRAKGAAWDLPAREELSAIYNNKAKLNTTLSSVGGTQLGTGYYWSSTEEAGNLAYCIIFSSGSRNYNYKNNSYSVRAVRAL